MFSYSYDVYGFVWGIWGLVATGVLLYVVYRYAITYLIYKIKYGKIRSADIFQVDRLEHEQFLTVLKKLFERQGYLVRTIDKKSEDEDVDLILMKGKHRVGVMARHTAPNLRVGSRWAALAYNASAKHVCEDTMVVTNGFYTPKTFKFAKRYQVMLCDRDWLLGQISSYRLQNSGRAA